MGAAELIRERRSLIRRIVKLLDDAKFWDEDDEGPGEFFLCLCHAHRAVCEELTFADREPVTQTVKSQLELVLGILADAGNRDPRASSGYREATTALRLIMDNEVPF